ncbi:hypothetical protein QLH51_02250 [Sphingomonas sp. 2R-10]|uniref:hypothetical protein n=1 Tax=Sphingomonas sp. 2R-10 TaxID=3045148 RepID=UPI0019D2833A|nr:hypothetical protein [Sphingomonas sp. 2R-10]MDJ0275629.1 hypothetical protein [Sphingomonas sp. 2R-10]
MTALVLLGLGLQVSQVTPPAPPADAQAAPVVRSPIDWDALPPLPYRRTPRPTAQMTAFVLAEMKRAGCPRPIPVAGNNQLRVDVAVLIGEDHVVRATIPRAIRCPTVEQYAAGLVVSYARGNLVPRFVNAGNWYRAVLLFDWVE